MTLTRDQLRHFRQRLEVLAEQIGTRELVAGDSADVVELDQSRLGRLSRMDALQSQAMSAQGSRRRGELRGRIREALERLRAGDYGDCLECGNPIAPARLEIDPAAALCVGCAEQAE